MVRPRRAPASGWRWSPCPCRAEDVAWIESLATAPDVISAMDLLADLPEDQRLLVTGRVIRERSYAELAGEQGLTQTAVRKRVSRGLATLRGRLQEEDHDR